MIFTKLILVFLSAVSFGKNKSDSADLKNLNTAFKPYKEADLVELDIEKVITQELLGTEKTFTGKIYFSKGLFRLETDKPEKTLILFDGKWIWNVKYFDPIISVTPQVSRMKANTKSESQMSLAKIMGKGKISDIFKIVNVKSEDSVSHFSLIPKTNLEARELIVSVNNKSNKILSLKYRDDLNNETLIKVLSATFLKSTDQRKFKYKPPKGVQVINL